MGFCRHHGDIRIDTAIGGAEENRQNSRKARTCFTDAVTQGSLFRNFNTTDFLTGMTEDTDKDGQEGEGGRREEQGCRADIIE